MEDHRVELDLVADALVARETMSGAELKQLIADHAAAVAGPPPAATAAVEVSVKAPTVGAGAAAAAA